MPSSQFKHLLHHRSNPIVDLVDRSAAHEGAGGDQLVLLIHVALTNALADVLTAQLVDRCSRVRGVRIPARKKTEKENNIESAFPASSFRINHKNNQNPDISPSTSYTLMFTDSLFILFNTNCDLTARKHFGSQDGGDAAEADGFPLAMEGLQHSLDLAVHRALLPLHRPRTQVFGRTKTTCRSSKNTGNNNHCQQTSIPVGYDR